MKNLLLAFSFVLLASVAVAGPAKGVKKSYYTTPIKEFKSGAFFQWKKFRPAPSEKAVAAGKEASEAGSVDAQGNSRATDSEVKPVSVSTRKD